MKKIFFLFFIIFQLATATEKDSLNKAYQFNNQYYVPEQLLCDACGCSASGGSMGFTSMLNTNFIGVRYLNQQYKSTDGLYSNSAWYNETFNTIQIWARIPVFKKVQISALVPYHYHERETSTQNQSINGVGDITVLAMYNLYQTIPNSASVEHNLQMGAGIKVPTGRFDQANAGNINPSFQVGTGSWDYLLSTEYVVKRKKWNVNTMVNYIIKTQNDKKYRFGNQFNYASTIFYMYEKNKFSLAPQLGVAGEVYATNYQYAEIVHKTAGDVFFGKVGIEVGKNKFSMGANVMLPINQNLAANRVEANYRWTINLNYSL